MLVIEDILDRIARIAQLPPDVVRERNFYREGDTTHYGQPVKDAARIERHLERIEGSSEFERAAATPCGISTPRIRIPSAASRSRR